MRPRHESAYVEKYTEIIFECIIFLLYARLQFGETLNYEFPHRVTSVLVAVKMAPGSFIRGPRHRPCIVLVARYPEVATVKVYI